MKIQATLKNQEQFVQQFAQQVNGKENRCLNAHSVIFPDTAGSISYISHSHFSFILSNVLLREEKVILWTLDCLLTEPLKVVF